MAFELAKAFVSVGVDAAKVPAQLEGVKSKVTRAVASINQVAAGIGIGIGVSMITSQLGKMAAAAEESIKSQQRLAGVLKATGGAAGFNTEQLDAFATQLSEVTGTDDEMIMDSMSKLLTFKQVTGDTFKEATKLAVDLAATGFGSIESAVTMLGKALENPLEGMSALRRVGVTITSEQKQQIETLMELNKLWEAQNIILEAVRGQVGGVAASTATELDKARVKLGNLQEEAGKNVIPAMERLNEALIKVLATTIKLVDKTAEWLVALKDGPDFYPKPGGPPIDTEGGTTIGLYNQGIAAARNRMVEAAARGDEGAAMSYKAQMLRMQNELNNLLEGKPKNAPLTPPVPPPKPPVPTDAERQGEFNRSMYMLGMLGSTFGTAVQMSFRKIFGPLDPRGIFGQQQKPAQQAGGLKAGAQFGLEEFNNAFQEALNNQANPVHKSNEHLRGIELAMDLVQRSTKETATGIAELIRKGTSTLAPAVFPIATQ